MAANLLMVLIILGGLTTLGGIPREMFPELRSGIVTVTVPHLGAAPAEVERSICLRLEEALDGLDDAESVGCRAAEGVGVATIELEDGADQGEALEEVRERIGALDTLPPEAEEPIVREGKGIQLVMSLALSGPVSDPLPPIELKRLAEELRDDLRRTVDAGRVVLAAARDSEIALEVSERTLRRHGLTFDELASALRRASIDLPGGSLDTDDGAVLLRASGQALEREHFERLTVRTAADGRRVELGELATVRDGLAEDGPSARFDGRPAILIQVYRGSGDDVVSLAESVHAFVERRRADLPPGVALTVWQDDARLVADRLETLLSNCRAGLVLVLVVLALFLRLRLAAWVTVGIPISILGALWAMPLVDVTINELSIIAFLIVLGIVVDDAIVVGENIHRHQRLGVAPLEAAERGVEEVAVPVVLSVVTTVLAFAPLAASPGNAGKVLRVIPIVAVLTLTVSLVESLLVLPAHLAHTPTRPRSEASSGRWAQLQDRLAGLLDRVALGVYRPVLEAALGHRAIALATALALFVFTLGLLAGGHVAFSYFPRIEGDSAVALVTLSPGAGEAATRRTVAALEDGLERVRAELASEQGRELDDGPEVVRHVLVTRGEQPWAARVAAHSTGIVSEGATGDHLAEIHVELTPAEERAISTDDFAERWRRSVGTLPDVEELVFDTTLFAIGRDLDLRLEARDPRTLAEGAARVRAFLDDVPGVVNVADSLRAGKPEIHLEVTPTAEAAGVRLADLARQARQAFYGEEVQRLQRRAEELKVMLRYPRDERRSLGHLEAMRVRVPDGGELAFSTAARTRLERGPATIERLDGRRVAHVTADVDPSRATPPQVVSRLRSELLPILERDLPGLGVRFEGQEAEQEESGGGLLRAMALSLFAIYALLAVAFRSYVQPLVVLAAVPFGLVGAVWGHFLLGIDLTIFSAFGIVALTGVVVNDSLVLVSFVNRHLEAPSDDERREPGFLNALRRAGIERFRPILLTSLTTFAGLSPLMLERSVQAQFLVPLAASIAFGVVVSTAVILILVPVLLSLIDSARRLRPVGD